MLSPMPNRASELVWDEPEPRAQDGLTRAIVVRAALAIADADGLGAVSIRRVAAQLDVRPMSLYTHIASKDDLVELMVNEAVAEVVVPEPLPEHWRDALAEIARHSYAAFVAHPWVLEAFSRRTRIGPNVARHAEQSMTAVAGLGLDWREARAVLAIVDDYTLGHSIRAATFASVADFPGEDTFELGLDTVLDGVERRFASR
jgi:AcrR family transcriptional regulator